MDRLNIHNFIDLHVHLGSASTPHFLWELGHYQGIKLPKKNYWEFLEYVKITKKTTYNKYLTYFSLAELIQSSPYAVERSIHEAVSLSYRKALVKTIEIRFNPMFRNNKGAYDLDKIIFSALVGMKKAMLEYPVKAGIILMMDRRLNKEQNTIISEKAIRFQQEGIVGIDIAGPIKKSFSFKDITGIIHKAKKHGLGITVHTGEVTPAKEITDVVKLLEPDRIGHGIRAVDDCNLLHILAKKKIILEICPTSNVMTNAVRDWKEMKTIIRTFQKHNVLFTINSDGPVLLSTNVKQEYEKLYQKGILTGDEIKNCIRLAYQASFIPPSRNTIGR